MNNQTSNYKASKERKTMSNSEKGTVICTLIDTHSRQNGERMNQGKEGTWLMEC